MKALSSVLLVLVAAASPAFADSAYFLKPATRSTPAAITTTTVVRSTPVRTDRISTHYLSRSLAKPAKGVTPTIRPHRIFTRGAGQAAIVR